MKVRHEITIVDSEDTEVVLVFEEERLRTLYRELGDILEKYSTKPSSNIHEDERWPWQSLEDKWQ